MSDLKKVFGPMRTGKSEMIGRMLLNNGHASIDDLLVICKSRQSIYVAINQLRKRLKNGYRIVTNADGYALVDDSDHKIERVVVENSCNCDALKLTQDALSNKALQLQKRISEINDQLVSLNSEKQALKEDLQIIESGLMALDRLEDGS